MEDKYLKQLKEFFEAREVCSKAAKPLRDSASAEIAIPVENKTYTFQRKDKKNVVSAGKPSDPDLYFALTPKALEELINYDSDEIGDWGVKVFSLIFTKDIEKKIVIKIKTGLLKLTFKGYLGIIPLGGAGLMKYLAKNGFSSLGKIKDALTKAKD